MSPNSLPASKKLISILIQSVILAIIYTYAMDWMFVSLQNSHVEILTPNVMVSGGGTFGWWLGQVGEALLTGISAVIIETPESFSCLLLWGYSKNTDIYEPGNGP